MIFYDKNSFLKHETVAALPRLSKLVLVLSLLSPKAEPELCSMPAGHWDRSEDYLTMHYFSFF